MCGLRGFIRTPWLFVLHGVQVCDPADIDRDTPGGDTTFLNFNNSFISQMFFLFTYRFYLATVLSFRKLPKVRAVLYQ